MEFKKFNAIKSRKGKKDESMINKKQDERGQYKYITGHDKCK